MEIAGFIGAFLMGLSLGLVGSGGSILTVPILVYLFYIDTLIATTYSLFIVGITSLVGATVRAGAGNIHWPTTLVFGIPSLTAVYLTRSFLLPLIPPVIFQLGDFVLTKSLFLLLLFAVLMLIASFFMVRDQAETTEEDKTQGSSSYNLFSLSIKGMLAGCITGLLGAGGGFLIIPALVLMANLPMKKAVGTSLVIITANSFMGFWRDYQLHELIDWRFLVYFSTIAITGILTGSSIAHKISGEKLKPIFGYFILLMGAFIIFKELFLR
ncbi:sulfite exporter TauE/SafE family protein [Runella aurantiaca]|uniref:Probable membrane transporter protein n=1 Tax=Runella aurantiaca TaxID=2282308 RepID=A0A369IET9_9BACT|nr:sulfite exporter TauE/SafE family protein [Runella aurantiaca]RDB06785.1 sulfite exporter TauE/SafE family protein [Runella aurantiaca]